MKVTWPGRLKCRGMQPEGLMSLPRGSPHGIALLCAQSSSILVDMETHRLPHFQGLVVQHVASLRVDLKQNKTMLFKCFSMLFNGRLKGFSGHLQG